MDCVLNSQQAEATKRFKEISEAFQVLSDEDERRIHDRSFREVFRRPGERQDQRFEDPSSQLRHVRRFLDPYDLFRNIFGDVNPLVLIDNLLTSAGASSTTRAVTNTALQIAVSTTQVVTNSALLFADVLQQFR
jgi:DnaJ-class molecular chaperone